MISIKQFNLDISQGLRSYVGTFQPNAALFSEAPYPLGLSNFWYVLSTLFLFSGENGTLEASDPNLNAQYSFLAVLSPFMAAPALPPNAEPT